MYLVLMEVCMSGVGAFNPFHFALKYQILMADCDESFAIPGTLGRLAISGTLDRPTVFRSAGFSSPFTTASTPLKLQLPAPMCTIR